MEDLRQPRSIPNLGQHVLVLTFEGDIAVEEFLDVVISHPFFRMDDAFVEGVMMGSGKKSFSFILSFILTPHKNRLPEE